MLIVAGDISDDLDDVRCVVHLQVAGLRGCGDARELSSISVLRVGQGGIRASRCLSQFGAERRQLGTSSHITSVPHSRVALTALKRRFPIVFFCPGNHELWVS